MTIGTLFYVVGPSGAGKDTLIAEALGRLRPSGRYTAARRWITRPAAVGEDHTPVGDDEFETLRRDGLILHAWEAHGLKYALPTSILDDLDRGVNVLANGSRAALPALGDRIPRLVVVEITAPIDVLRARIAARGRETGDDLEERLARALAPLTVDGDHVTVINDRTITEAADTLVSALECFAARLTLRELPLSAGNGAIAALSRACDRVDASAFLASGRLEIRKGDTATCAPVVIDDAGWLAPDEIALSSEAFRKFGQTSGALVSIGLTPSPTSRRLLRRKIAGERLGEDDYGALFADIVAGQYSDAEVAAFLLKTIQSLDDTEVVAIARARRRFMRRIDWGRPIVVDKHSLGGIPGNRITLIVVPIVTAHGLLMPKTSSRAITSASGTADVMEVAARIDLDPSEMRAVVEAVGGCIAWNGRLNHSPLDDIVNAFTRSLGLDSNHWSVASILSKKWSAGATHVVIDIPYGPRAKVKTPTEAGELGRIFEAVGAALDMTVKALVTRADGAIGRGIGPALELRDVLQVLGDDPAAPTDLRDKALLFAANILAFSPQVGSIERGRAIAQSLLSTGAAKAQFEAICAAQGARPPCAPGTQTHVVRAPAAGTIERLDGWQLAGIARRAGAPFDRCAGIDLHVAFDDVVELGSPLFTIHASAAAELQGAIDLAAEDTGVTSGPRARFRSR